MSASEPPTPSLLASPWVAVLGLGLAVFGLARLLWSDGPDLAVVLLGLFCVTLSGHARTPRGERRQRRLFEGAMVVLLVAQLLLAFA